jgi:hypothetical protein
LRHEPPPTNPHNPELGQDVLEEEAPRHAEQFRRLVRRERQPSQTDPAIDPVTLKGITGYGVVAATTP